MQQLDLSNFDRIVILAPHPDDEILGCASLFQHYKDKIITVYLTDGCFYNYPTVKSKKAADIRRAELKGLNKELGTDFAYLGLKDSHLKAQKKPFYEGIVEVCRSFKLDTKKIAWFVPNPKESHEDHKCVGNMLVHTFYFHVSGEGHENFKIFTYEVWTPHTTPTHYLSVNPEIKANLMREHYKSQVEHLPAYIEGILGLNKYRGLQALQDNYLEVFSV